jgi:hypothetical protein
MSRSRRQLAPFAMNSFSEIPLAMRQKLLIFLTLFTLTFSLPPTVSAQDYTGRTVKVKRKSGRTMVGKVLSQNADEIVLELPYGKLTIPRSNIEEIIDAQALIDEHKQRKAKCKTGEDFWKLAMWAEKKELDRKLIRDDLNKAIEADPDHEKARLRLGYRKFVDERGNTKWVYKRTEGELDDMAKGVAAERDAVKDRPWEENEVVLKLPNASNPEYEIHSNCPEELARQYGNFMVKLKKGLIRLVRGIDPERNVKFRNLGPGKIFICNSQKLFREITGQTAGVGGFYTPGFFPAGEAERCIVAFHGTFGFSGDTYKVLGHEGTHQLQGLMWYGSFSSRPPWLIEGLAVYFGDGHYLTKKGEFKIGIPRDRLNTLRRGFSSKRYIRLRNLLYTPYAQFGGFHYAHGWGLIHWMLHSGQSITFRGKSYDLKKVFGEFFKRNLKQGFQHLPALMGARSNEDVRNLANQMEEPWINYINGLQPPSVGVFDKKDKRLFISESVGFSLKTPKPQRKKKIEWNFVPESGLKTGELIALTEKNSSAKFIVSQAANTDVILNVDALAQRVRRRLLSSYEGLEMLPGEKDELHGRSSYALNFTGTEKKNEFLNPEPYPNKIRVRLIVYLNGKNYFVLKCQADVDDYKSVDKDFRENVLPGFKIIFKK